MAGRVIPGPESPGVPHALDVEHLSKSFAGAKALNDVVLDVRAGEVHALVGENGSGKSTLIKILSGYHEPDPGSSILVAGRPLSTGNAVSSHRAGCRFVHQDLGLVDALSVADNLTLGVGYPMRLGTIRNRSWRRQIRQALDTVHLDVDPDVLVGELSPAAKTGVALARALRDETHGVPALLVLDEPTASLPSPQVAELHAMVRTVAARGIGVLYVSHHLQEIFDLCDRVTVLRDGVRVGTEAPSGLSHHALVELIVGAAADVTPVAARTRTPARSVVQIAGLGQGPLTALDLELGDGEIVGIAGITGSGRDQVLPAVFGATGRRVGSVRIDGTNLPAGRPRRSMQLGLAYLPPDRKTNGGVMTLTARENISLTGLGEFWRFPLLRRRQEHEAATELFARLDVRPAGAVEKNLETFSGGNQQKVLLAKWLRRSPRVLLLDEPTQGVDIAAKALLHRHVRLAAERGASVLVSSSDNDELAELCDRVIVMADGRPRCELSGDGLTVTSLTHAVLGQPDRQERS